MNRSEFLSYCSSKAGEEKTVVLEDGKTVTILPLTALELSHIRNQYIEPDPKTGGVRLTDWNLYEVHMVMASLIDQDGERMFTESQQDFDSDSLQEFADTVPSVVLNVIAAAVRDINGLLRSVETAEKNLQETPNSDSSTG
jgi:hypothetical protein